MNIVWQHNIQALENFHINDTLNLSKQGKNEIRDGLRNINELFQLLEI